ncbi:esterase-like activity of phytase family protein [Candidatus Thiothrix sp. Deng01]|uniref:Esterase-like activity of phytase family protein n=1 Tax=Candidatus Thiothrix phosphatis TaxID=3112415 RepID=A0ABU6CVP0_9GAMM|nr:esterase-like activity of phytase family protein [Candidatus Thiothrix sp. Deng01]MEB4590878.1 esterase-like activity of phytase family protein [Candidatus Thiothrix sp. Deng01]
MKRSVLVLLALLPIVLFPLEGLAVSPQLEIRDTVAIPPLTVDGVRISELSGLAWDQDEQLLYAVSDKGSIFHFRLALVDNRIKAVDPVYAAKLLDLDGCPLGKGKRDSEGLDVLNAANGRHGDTQLVISFEGTPRIVRFTPQGKAIAQVNFPGPISNRQAYRNGNKELESVTFHPRYGFITAPELPLKGQPINRHTLYSNKGQRWSFDAYPAENSGISDLATLPDGNLLILERAWSGIFNPLVVSLRYLDFSQCSKAGVCPVKDLKTLSSLFLVDNYEGLTHIQGNQYLMVSDDNNEELLRTALTLFTLDLVK